MIRPATPDDAAAIAAIYNRCIEDREFAHCDLAPMDQHAQARKLATAAPWHPTFVSVGADGSVDGWGALKPFRSRPHLRRCAEIAAFIAPASRHGVVGAWLTFELLRAADRLEIDTLVAIVIHLNSASLRGLEAAGFTTAAVVRDAAFLHGRWIDSVWLTRAHGVRSPLFELFERRLASRVSP